MLRFSLLTAALCLACGGSSFDIPVENGGEIDTGTSSTGDAGDTGVTTTTDSGATDTDVPPPIDSGTATDTSTPPPDTAVPCTAQGPDATDLYVNASVAATGMGAASCPFKTILEATQHPRSTGVVRTIHVAAGSYAETDVVSVTGTTTLKGEGGVVKITGGSKGACNPTPDKCVVRTEGAATVIGVTVDASGVPLGIVMAGGAAKIVSSTVKNAVRDGIAIANGGELGPEIHVDENGNAGVVIRAGNLKVVAGANTFDRNKGVGMWAGSVYIQAGGIVLYGASTLDFGGGSASNNNHGVVFDWSGTGTTAMQTINKLVAQNNRAGGVSLTANHSATIRNSVLTKNGQYGLWFSYGNAGNKLDIGSSGSPGGNTFGGGSDKNGKVGIFLCRSQATGSQAADSNSWSVCPPIQLPAANCDAWPASYADVGYVPGAAFTATGANPAAATSCKVGP